MKTLAAEFSVKLPSNFKEQDRAFFEPHFQNPLYPPKVISIKNTFFFKHGMLYDSKLNQVKEHQPWDMIDQRFEKKYFIKASIKYLFSNNIAFLFPSKIKYALVTNGYSHNFYHWFTEVVPKLIILMRELDQVEILLPDNYNKTYQIETLKILKVKYRSIKKELFFIKNIYIATRESDYITYYSKFTLKCSNALLSPQSLIKQHSYNKIYISRNKANRRRLINERDILPILMKYDFKIVYPEEMTLQQSIDIFSRTSHLVSIHGAGLTNMIFMPRHSSIFEFLNENTLVDKCYFTLSLACEHDYYYQTCKGTGEDANNHIYADLKIDIVEFEKEIKAFLKV